MDTFSDEFYFFQILLNPLQVISILGETLETFDEDNFIPAFGFGDVTTKDFGVFPFLNEVKCNMLGIVFT